MEEKAREETARQISPSVLSENSVSLELIE